MSIQAITAALAFKMCSPSEKLLLIAWANYADENLRCYPSNKRLSDDTGLSDRQIRRLAGNLSERGFIERIERFRADGSRSTDIVFLKCLRGDTVSGGVGTPCPGGGDMMAAQNQSLNQEGSKEPISSPAAPKAVRDGVFLEAWKAYPAKGRERSKSQAKTAPIWREAARQAGGPERLLAAVKRYVAQDKTHKGECGPPAFDRWLRDGRWEHWLSVEQTVVTLTPMNDDLAAKRRALLMGE
jgi:hypothetical protein